MRLLFKKLWEPKQALRFANFIILILGGIAVLGTLPSGIIPFLGSPHSIYNHPAFLFLLGFLALLTFLATLRMGYAAFRSKYPITCQREFFLPSQKLSSLRAALIPYLKSRGFRIFPGENKDSAFFLNGLKHKSGIWGSFLLHLGFLIVVLGGFLTFRFADIREVMIPEGETIILPVAEAKVALEKFTMTLGSGKRTVEEYNSRLLVQNREGKVFHYDLKVNHPLNIEGTKLFQMRYRVDVQDIELTVYRDGKALEKMKLKLGGKQQLAGLPFVVEATRVVSDFVMDNKGEVVSRSPYFKNPAVLVSLYDTLSAKVPMTQQWAVEGMFFHGRQQQKEWSFVLNKAREHYSSGIKFSRDPGMPVVYGGFLFLVLGAFISGFLTPLSITLQGSLSLDGKGAVIRINGYGIKDPMSLNLETESAVRSLECIIRAGD